MTKRRSPGREESIEPPTSGRCDRIVGAALRAAEESLTALISSRLTVESIERIVAQVAGADQGDAGPAGGGAEGEDVPPVLAKAKEAPGNVSFLTTRPCAPGQAKRRTRLPRSGPGNLPGRLTRRPSMFHRGVRSLPVRTYVES
ncbi:hypothetical protein ACIOK4_43575 [Streptomyces bottropensis]|uniref:hypothetical protein n=1 Tax=Streptomyces bottropensis TaxID=42235 RepID=UPI003803F097